MNTKTIVIDTLGSDRGPETILLGASLLLKAHEEIAVVLVGDQTLINTKIQELEMDASRIKIIHSERTISNNDNIMEAFFQKRDASLIRALEETSKNDDVIGLITAGNSGAIVVGAIQFLKSPDLTRPCMAAILPTFNHSFVCLIDTGATIDCTSAQLHGFAKLGRDLMRNLYKIENPRIGLLSNGAEAHKGNKLVKETHPILASDTELNFVGNVEANIALAGSCDVLVADGFASNMILKSLEGTMAGLLREIGGYAKANNIPEIKPLMGYLLKTYDITSLGGAIVLGARKPIIKCRGNSGELAILNTSEMLINLNEGKTFFEGKDER